MKINEGNKYYFRNINWIGNTKYRTGQLDSILGISKGDEYNKMRLESKLFMSQTELDISSLYMDQGHLFFQVTPIEKTVENESIILNDSQKITSQEGLTFDDVLLVPQYSDIEHRSEVSVSTKILPGLELEQPFVAANMDTVTEYNMAFSMASSLFKSSSFSGIITSPDFSSSNICVLLIS